MTYFQIDFLYTHNLSWLQMSLTHVISYPVKCLYCHRTSTYKACHYLSDSKGMFSKMQKHEGNTWSLSQKVYQQNNQIAAGHPAIALWEEGRKKKCLEQFCEWLYLHDDAKMIRRNRSKIRQLLIFYSAWPRLTAILSWSANNPL